MENTIQGICRIADSMPGNYIVYQVQNESYRLLYHTCGIPALAGLTEAEFAAVPSVYELVLEEDRAMIRRKLAEQLCFPDTGEFDFLFRLCHKALGFIWVHLTAKKYADVDGCAVYLANFLNVSKETSISYAMMDASDRNICVIERSTKRFLYANSKFYDLIDSSPAEAMGKHCYELLCKALEMKNNDNCLCYSSINADPPIETYNPAKDKYLTITGREVIWGEYSAYVFYLSDITEKKRQEEKLLDSQKRFEIALANSELMVWEYDIVNHRCINSEKAGRDYNIPLVIENYPESLFTTGHTPPETIAQIKDVQRRLLNGETGFSVERRTIDKYGRSQWQKVEYTLECDAAGKPLRAIVCGLDITIQKELEQKYEEQMEYRNKLAQNALFSIRLDLDSNVISDFTSLEPCFEEIVRNAQNADEFLTTFFRAAVFEEGGGVLPQHLTAAALKETYSIGQSQLHAVYRFIPLNLYLDLNLTMYKRPGSGHLEVFYVLTDVTSSVLMQSAFQRVVTKDYDFVALIHKDSGKMRFLAYSGAAVLPEQAKGHGQELTEDYNTLVVSFAEMFRRYYHSAEDYLAVSQGILLPNIVQKLQTMPVYEFNCKTRTENGQIHTYRLSFSYSDPTQSRIVFTRANISQVVQEEQRNQQELENALSAAKAADRAKTDFLSRMSHDMRTPMNGIIGMTRLTQDIPSLPVEAQNNLSAISDSSAYLLQLINDTLDMNKIESDRFLLHPEVVDTSELVQHILATIRPLVEAKALQLRFVPIHTELEFIRVDRVRIQQILLNILSNAVKFTPAGGTVRWEIEVLRRENSISHCRLSVEDNGCGMSEEYLQHIFEPFSQEHTRIISGQEGTGLGMAIVKNLVELMGGRIEIYSKLDVGTRVTLYLSFERVYGPEQQKALQNKADTTALFQRRVLLTEDHPLNATIAKRLLEKKGMLVEHAENGAQAVQLFAKSPLHYYDLILMDIRMPEMDGLQATRAIRALERKDAGTIPILAMTANAYAEDVQAALDAGMNAHLAKPIEPELLYTEIARFF